MKKDRLQTYLIILIAIVTISLITVSDSVSMVTYNVVDMDEETETKALTDGLIDINSATLEELMTVSGIGEVIAQRIIDYREEHGDFLYIEQLEEVEGIGEVKLQEIMSQCFV